MCDNKVVVFGVGAVGKSALVYQYVFKEFLKYYDPTIEDWYRVPVPYKGQIYGLEILDTAGQDDFIAMRTLYMRQGKGFIIVYSIDDRSSFEAVDTFYKDITRTKETAQFPCIIVGNKCDNEDRREVSRAEGEELAQFHGCRFLEASAKNNINVSEVFVGILDEILKTQPGYETSIAVPPVENGGCCTIQ